MAKLALVLAPTRTHNPTIIIIDLKVSLRIRNEIIGVMTSFQI